MLVLSRREQETIVIETPTGDVIHVMPTRIRDGRVQIGIDAPPAYIIHREELRE
jgi:carbon storage regulator CsrA